jgi:DNA-binding MarR family transcriptional regulator
VDASIVSSFRTIARALDRVMLPRLIELGISMPQFKSLIAVVSAGAGGISVTNLGSELSIGQPSASLIVDQLERLGYVERIPDTVDRRRVYVTATALGMQVTGELRHGRRSTFAAWLAKVGQEDAEALAHGLRSLAMAVQASPEGRPPVH